MWTLIEIKLEHKECADFGHSAVALACKHLFPIAVFS